MLPCWSTAGRCLLGRVATAAVPHSQRCGYAATGRILPTEPVGPGGGGASQQVAKAMAAQLSAYDPQKHLEPVSIVRKHGMPLLWDPWCNKGVEGYVSRTELLCVVGMHEQITSGCTANPLASIFVACWWQAVKLWVWCCTHVLTFIASSAPNTQCHTRGPCHRPAGPR